MPTDDQPSPNDQRDPSDLTEPPSTAPLIEVKRPASWTTPQIGRRYPLPSNRACAITGVFAAILDGALLLNAGQSFSRAVVGSLFVGVFVYGGMRFLTATRRKIRPDAGSPATMKTGELNQQTPSSPPITTPKGGWANPTGAQKIGSRLSRIASNFRKRRDPPRR